MRVTLLQHTSENIVAQAIAKSHDAKPDLSMIQKCIEWGHLSVLEHWVATFDVDGISRSLLQQLARHRIGMSMIVRSQRYCAEDNAEVHVPEMRYLEAEERDYKQVLMEKWMRDAIGNYKQLLVEGVKPEDARYILPEATHTSLVLTANARALMHFFDLRLAKGAQAEIKELAYMMLEIVRGVAPNIFMEVS